MDYPHLLNIDVRLLGKTHLNRIALKCHNLEVLKLHVSRENLDPTESFYQIRTQNFFEKLTVLELDWDFVPPDVTAFLSHFPVLCELILTESIHHHYLCSANDYRALGEALPSSVKFVSVATVCVSCVKVLIGPLQLIALRVYAIAPEFDAFVVGFKHPRDNLQNLFVKGIRGAQGNYYLNGKRTTSCGRVFEKKMLSRLQ